MQLRGAAPLFAVCVAAIACSVASAAAGAAAAQGCGQVMVSYPAGQVGGGSDVAITSVVHIGCKAARAVTADCISHFTVRGWTAHVSRSNLQVMRLTNGRMAIELRGIAGGAPRCAASAYKRAGA